MTPLTTLFKEALKWNDFLHPKKQMIEIALGHTL
jgi:hypothetical protein